MSVFRKSNTTTPSEKVNAKQARRRAEYRKPRDRNKKSVGILQKKKNDTFPPYVRRIYIFVQEKKKLARQL